MTTLTGIAAAALVAGTLGSGPAHGTRDAVAGPYAAATTSSRITAAYSGRINTTYRSVVNDSYKARYAPYLNTPSGYTGLACLLGTMTQASRNATLSSVNYVRALAGLAPVSFGNATMNYKALQAAVIMQANGQLSHDPLTSWLCYTLGGGQAAAKSNLALYYPQIGSGQAVDLYMDDPGGNNVAAGHRRWVLYPFTTVMGDGTTKNANALTVIGPTSSTRPNPRWVRWPQAGYFPTQLEPVGRWSISSGYPGDRFGNAWVRMWKGSTRIYPHKYAVHNGYGMPTLVWQLPSGVRRTGAFTVQVGNVCRTGVGCFNVPKYTVRLFTAS